MSEESTTPDLVALARRGYEALSAGDLDEVLRLLTHDAVVDMTRTVGLLIHGRDAIRVFQEDWFAGYDDVAYTPEEIIDAGNGVAFVKVLQIARPKGTSGHLTQREPNIVITEEGRVARMIIYPQSELDEARADAERLAEERG
jgi:ketosteroid isomerase-like protein